MTAPTLLIELGTEELPPSHLATLSNAFSEKISSQLTALGFTFDKVVHYASPRRLSLQIFNLPALQPNRTLEKRGPALSAAFDSQGQPTLAALGFARSCGIDPAALKTVETEQGAWVFALLELPGKTLEELLAPIIENAIQSIPAPKKMRWGRFDLAFLRPIHWVTVIHGNQGLNLSVFNLRTSNQSYGHHFHFPHPITIENADDYLSRLKEYKVIACHRERRQLIVQGIHNRAKEVHGNALIDESLLDTVTGLVEWPVALCAHFDSAFLEVPKEALISSMQNHQKCFAIEDLSEKLLPHFILISNTQANPPDNILVGNERVMRARLSDAKFFFEKDKKTSLESRLEKLKSMVFQKKLGTLYDKTQRIAKLSGHIAKLTHAPIREAEQAAKLCKADLLTEMVFEFPELQGVMGQHYALHDHESPVVAQAIFESYLPRNAKDVLPQTPVGICVALADRLDTLIGIFGIGQIPSGDKDPFALRRQAVAILRILIEKELPLDLKELLKMARAGYGAMVDPEIVDKVLLFCFERFKAWYQEQGIQIQTLEAVINSRTTQPYDCSRRVLAVDHFSKIPQAQHLAAANKRVSNILQKCGVHFAPAHLPQMDEDLLREPAEKQLYQHIMILKSQTEPLIAQGDYQTALTQLATLQPDVDAFFDTVLVLCEQDNLKRNRIHLLCYLQALFMQIADVSKLAI